jgi:hypothetical protein
LKQDVDAKFDQSKRRQAASQGAGYATAGKLLEAGAFSRIRGKLGVEPRNGAKAATSAAVAFFVANLPSAPF